MGGKKVKSGVSGEVDGTRFFYEEFIIVASSSANPLDE